MSYHISDHEINIIVSRARVHHIIVSETFICESREQRYIVSFFHIVSQEATYRMLYRKKKKKKQTNKHDKLFRFRLV